MSFYAAGDHHFGQRLAHTRYTDAVFLCDTHSETSAAVLWEMFSDIFGIDTHPSVEDLVMNFVCFRMGCKEELRALC